jgi:hypothetical protein
MKSKTQTTLSVSGLITCAALVVGAAIFNRGLPTPSTESQMHWLLAGGGLLALLCYHLALGFHPRQRGWRSLYLAIGVLLTVGWYVGSLVPAYKNDLNRAIAHAETHLKPGVKVSTPTWDEGRLSKHLAAPLLEDQLRTVENKIEASSAYRSTLTVTGSIAQRATGVPQFFGYPFASLAVMLLSLVRVKAKKAASPTEADVDPAMDEAMDKIENDNPNRKCLEDVSRSRIVRDSCRRMREEAEAGSGRSDIRAAALEPVDNATDDLDADLSFASVFQSAVAIMSFVGSIAGLAEALKSASDTKRLSETVTKLGVAFDWTTLIIFLLITIYAGSVRRMVEALRSAQVDCIERALTVLKYMRSQLQRDFTYVLQELVTPRVDSALAVLESISAAVVSRDGNPGVPGCADLLGSISRQAESVPKIAAGVGAVGDRLGVLNGRMDEVRDRTGAIVAALGTTPTANGAAGIVGQLRAVVDGLKQGASDLQKQIVATTTDLGSRIQQAAAQADAASKAETTAIANGSGSVTRAVEDLRQKVVAATTSLQNELGRVSTEAEKGTEARTTKLVEAILGASKEFEGLCKQIEKASTELHGELRQVSVADNTAADARSATLINELGRASQAIAELRMLLESLPGSSATAMADRLGHLQVSFGPMLNGSAKSHPSA